MQKTVWAAFGCMVAFGTFAAGDYPIRSADITKVKVTGGFWQSRLATNRIATLKGNFRKCEETHRIANFVDAGKRLKGTFKGIPFNDSDVFKVMEAAAYMLALAPDPELEKYMTWLIGEVGKAQEEDGYLYTARTLGYSSRMMGRTRWSNIPASHELYNVGHMYEAAVAWYEATGRDDFLRIARKSADLVDKVFGPGPGQLKDAPGHEEIELALVKLYRVTGERRYLDLARHFLEMRGRKNGCKVSTVRFTQSGDLTANSEMKEPGAYAQNHRPAAEQRVAVGHAVRAGYLYCAMADVAALTGDSRYIAAITAIWDDVAGRKLHLNGSIGARHAGEAFGEPYELPNATAYLETCAGIGNALWNERLFRTTGEAKYMDVVERVIYNGFLSGISLSGLEYFYPNPLASKGGYRRSLWFGCSCCPVNIVRFIPQIPRMAYATDGKGVFYVNLFLASEAEMDGVKFRTETDYPWDGRVRIVVTPKRAGDRFTVKVRVPGWARGRPVPSDLYAQVTPSAFANEQGYRVYDRVWQPGDAIELDFPMPVQRIRAHEKVVADRGRLAVERGPILYCIEGADNGGSAFNALLPADETFADDTITIGDRRFPALKASGGLKLIPYFAWDHRRPGNEMQVWPMTDLPRNNRFGWGVLASHCHSADAVDALLDGVLPAASNDETIPRFTVWPHRGTEEWIEFRLPKAETLKGFGVYWFCDLPKGRCDLPAGWRVQCRADAGAAWTDVPGKYPVEKDGFSRGVFDAPVTASCFRIVARSKPNLSGGILELKPMK